MGKTRSGTDELRSIPAVERILSSAAFQPLHAEYGRERVKDAVVAHLATLRAARTPWNESEALSAVAASIDGAIRSSLRRTINGTGVILHTNLGRAPLDQRIWEEAAGIAARYANLELDLATGERGARDQHLTALCQAVFGCEAAILTNNNAAGTMLALAALAPGREVIVSRGELVEIGGGFRVPDVIQQGGARLREVGTTNRTRASDYAAAVSRRTAAILRVHRSNFDIVGFTETPGVAELVDVARQARVPFLFDEGSGAVIALERYGFASGITVPEAIGLGVDLVTCSTDKLIGAAQGGLILGREELVERCRRHPLLRAVRVGKDAYALVAATLRAFATGRHEEWIAIYRMLARPMPDLHDRARSIASGTDCSIVESRSALGGGTTPAESIPSVAVELPGNAEALHAKFLRNDPPIVGRIRNDRFGIDVRTLLDDDLQEVRAAIVEGQPRQDEQDR